MFKECQGEQCGWTSERGRVEMGLERSLGVGPYKICGPWEGLQLFNDGVGRPQLSFEQKSNKLRLTFFSGSL